MTKPKTTASRTAKPVRRDIAVRSQLVGAVLSFVRERGGDAQALAARFELPESAFDAPDVVLPLGQLQSFFDAAEAAIDDPCLGLHLVANVPARRFTALEYGAKSAATIRAALIHLARTTPLFNEHVVITFEERRQRHPLPSHCRHKQSAPATPNNQASSCRRACDCRRESGRTAGATNIDSTRHRRLDEAALHGLGGGSH